ncbi:MAG: Crp/Fnr family transcriptional regulator [Spirochaetia bacterium]
MAKKKKELDFLKKVGILNDLTDDELGRVLTICKKKQISANTVIMKEGEIGNTMYFFLEGEVNVSKSLTLKIRKKGFSSAEKSMNNLSAEHVSFFGEMAMFEDEPRSATITASMDCTLYEVERGDFTDLCKNHAETGVKILRRIAAVLSHRVRKGNNDILKLSTALSIALSK